MKKTLIILSLTLVLFLAACGTGQTPAAIMETPASTSIPDPCSTENLPEEAAKVNNLMREFDDYATLASNTPQAQLSTVIPDLQRVLREAEDQPVPACLETLKKTTACPHEHRCSNAIGLSKQFRRHCDQRRGYPGTRLP